MCFSSSIKQLLTSKIKQQKPDKILIKEPVKEESSFGSWQRKKVEEERKSAEEEGEKDRPTAVKKPARPMHPDHPHAYNDPTPNYFDHN